MLSIPMPDVTSDVRVQVSNSSMGGHGADCRAYFDDITRGKIAATISQS